MRNTLKLGAFALATAFAAAPVMAQTGTAVPATPNTATSGTAATGVAPHSAVTAPATGTVGNTAHTTPADRNPVMTQAGETRASKVIGSSVYNDHDEKVGSVDDLLVGKDGKLHAVLSVGGFLGMGTKYVEVPFANLVFGNTQKDSDNRVVLKGATKDTLKSQAAYSYYKS